MLRRDQHEADCEGVSLDSLSDEASLPIGEDHRLAVPKGRKRKAQDTNVVREGFPKPCPDSEICGVTKDLATHHLLNNHRTLHHDDKWPKETACNVPGCQLSPDFVFISRVLFSPHLRLFHFLNKTHPQQYIDKIIPQRKNQVLF
jgi:hypothetical protein